MAKIRVTYSSHRNISFRGVDEWEMEPEYIPDRGSYEFDDFIAEIWEQWASDNVDIHVEVVE